MKALPLLLLTVACGSFSRHISNYDYGDVSGDELMTSEFDLPVPKALCARRDANRPRDKIVVHEGRCDGPTLFQIVVTDPHARPFLPGRLFMSVHETRRNLRGVSATDLLARNTATDLVSRDLSFFDTDDLVVLNDPAERYRVIHFFYEDLDPERSRRAAEVIDAVAPRRTPFDRMPPNR